MEQQTKRQKRVSTAYEPIRVDSYSVYFGHDLVQEIVTTALEMSRAEKYVLLSDANVLALYQDKFTSLFKAAGHNLLVRAVPPGEQSKSRTVKAQIEDWMLSLNCNRKTCMLLLGGGVVGDLGGFIAATYMRGIPYFQIPTSLLAMVDSSIGGKTAIDVPAGKNLVGAFHRPLGVFIDFNFLTTLPARHLSNGMAEVIKAGCIKNEELFDTLERHSEEILGGHPELLAKVIHASVDIKARVVVEDEKEGGARSLLNFGHSVGHSIETLSQPHMLHGEAVSIGMVVEAVLARSRGLLTSAQVTRIEKICKAYKLPVEVPEELEVEDMVKGMAVDKKNDGGFKKVVMLKTIGECVCDPYTTGISDDELRIALSRYASVVPGLPHGSLAVPGSKSVSNRVLLMAAMGKGVCRINGLLQSDDTEVMLDSLRLLGVKFHWENNQKTLVMEGCGGVVHAPKGSQELYLKNAGTASRFLTSLVTTIPQGEIILTGNARMKERPIGDLVSALQSNGCAIKYLAKEGCLPVQVTGKGGLPGGVITLSPTTSSQFVSSILLSAPYARSPIKLVLDQSKGRVVSKPYIDMTAELMAAFGVKVIESKPFEYDIAPGAYFNPSVYNVEGDASSATYPLALAALGGHESTITVTNVGRKSTQGDAEFCRLLEKMGCRVEQSDSTTTVQGPPPGRLVGLGEVDLDKMTDSFMTLAVVAARAQGNTRIVNISNQRVKECNRIEAMVHQLALCGVEARELETGIEIVGSPILTAPSFPVLIDCHDDHRIAMSFAVLGSTVKNIVMDSKRCVEKTYPEFWDDLHSSLHLKLDPATILHPSLHGAQNGNVRSSSPSLVLIGMRGAGKTSFGSHVAEVTQRNFLDLDQDLEKELGLTVKEFVLREGWEPFRKRELEVFKRAVKMHSTDGSVISCGGGIVETHEALEILKSLPLVVEVRRHIDDIEEYLNQDSVRAPIPELRTVYARRQSLFRAAAKFEFVVPKGRCLNNHHHHHHYHRSLAQEFADFTLTVAGWRPVEIPRDSFFLSLTLPDIRSEASTLGEITEGADAVELRVDLLQQYDAEYVQDQLAVLRAATHLPVIFTVRTVREGGRFPLDEKAAFELLTLGLRSGCAYIDVESAWSSEARNALFAQKRNAKIISSHHITKNTPGDSELAEIFNSVGAHPLVDIVKVVTFANSPEDAVRVAAVANTYKSKPVIALAMGNKGKLSRVINKVLTPVTHPLLPTPAAPGQLSVAEIQGLRQTLGLVSPLKFYIFGSPVARSPSPLLHNEGFRWCRLPHNYSRFDTTDLGVINTHIRSPDFGGASVTVPLKEQVMSLMDSVSDSVKAIGALNTIIPTPNGLHGENTDWIGIVEPLRPLLKAPITKGDVAVVVGAGGTARAALFALQHLGFHGNHLVVHNPRTADKAVALAKHFNCSSSESLKVEDLHTSLFPNQQVSVRVRVVICTLPGSVNWTLPPHLLTSNSLPVVFDVSYLPVEGTTLIEQARQAGAPFVRGIDMLLAQGLRQFVLWTGRTAVGRAQAAFLRKAEAGKTL